MTGGKTFRTTAIVVVFLLTATAAPRRAPADAAAGQTAHDQDAPGIREQLTYHVAWKPPWYLFFLPSMEAGEAVLTLSDEFRYRDRKAVKITFTAKSSGALTRLAGISIDDLLEFTTDAETFCTISAFRKEREGTRMRDIEIAYFPEIRKMHMREIDVSKPAHRVLRDQDIEGIPPCIQDLFSALYALRRKDLSAGMKTQSVIGENLAIKEVQILVEKKLRVLTLAGPFDAWQINTVAIVGGLFKGGGHFHMWLSADDRKLPVKFEASVDLGKVTGSLEKIR